MNDQEWWTEEKQKQYSDKESIRFVIAVLLGFVFFAVLCAYSVELAWRFFP